MAKIEIEISKDLEFIRGVPDINWTVLVSAILKKKLEEIGELKKIISKSNLTEKDVEELSDKINTEAAKHYL